MKRVLVLTLAVVSTFAMTGFAAGSMKVDGWISDSMCGAKHMGTGEACVKKCIAGGSAPVFVDGDKKVWAIDNPDSVKDAYGKHVSVTATMDESAKSVHVTAVSVLPE